MGASFFFFVVCSFVGWGGEFVVTECKLNVLRLGPYVHFNKVMMTKLVSGGVLWAPNITKTI